MTTADYRKLALEAEAALEWGRALDYWQQAIDHYPTTGALAKRDLETMDARLDDCRRMYFPGA